MKKESKTISVLVQLSPDENYKLDLYLAKKRRYGDKGKSITKASEISRLAMIGMSHEGKDSSV